jgi:hypothetical protein
MLVRIGVGIHFPTSTKGAEFIAQHPRKYTHLDNGDFDGKPYPNTPQFFSTQPPKGGSSGGQGKSHKGSDKGTLPDDLHIVALSSNQQSYLSSTNSIIPLTDNLVTCFISLPQEKERTGRAKRFKILALLDTGSLAGDFISSDTFISLGILANNSVDRLHSSPICSDRRTISS